MRLLRFALFAVLLSLAACGTPTDNLSGANEYSTGSEADAPSASAASTAASAPAASTAAQTSADDPASRNNKYSAAPEMQIDPNKTYTATIETTDGTMTAELFAKDAPMTVNNFVFLAREDFYDGVKFHRIFKDFMVQTGDPTGTGTGGPGYRFDDEPVTRQYTRGTLAMANSGPNTNGSQFFIVHQDSGLDPAYTIFGQVTEGLDVLDAIANTPVTQGPNSIDPVPTTPLEDVLITNITINEQ